MFNHSDPLRENIVSGAPKVWKLYLLPNCSSEGIAQHLYSIFDPMVQKETAGRAFIISITITEDSKNSATYTPVSSQ